MEFTVEKDRLLNVVQQVSTALPARSTMPILQNILFEIKDGKMTLMASNLDFSIKGTIPVESVENVTFTLPGKPLLRILSTLEPTVLNISTSGNLTKLSWGKSYYDLAGQPPEDFPRMKELDGKNRVQILREDVLKGFSYTGFCAAKDDPRPFLNGILIEVEDGEFRMVASDAHKLAFYWKGVDATEGKIEAIVPRNVFDFLKGSDEESVRISQDGNNLSFEFSDTKLITRLIEGPYAPYREVIPKEEGFVFKCEKKELENILRRISEIVPTGSNLIEWHVGSTSYILAGSEFGEAKEELTGDYTGEEMRIGFNVRFLHEIVRHIDSDEILLHFYDPHQAVMIEPKKTEEMNYNLLYLLMPVKLE